MMICSIVCNASAYSEDHIRHTWVEEYFPEGGGCSEKPQPSEDGRYCFYDGWFVTKCSECPEILRQEWKELYREHDFVGNVCSKCGYAVTNKNNNQSRSCAHRNQEEYMVAGNVFNNENNGKCVQEGYFIKYCPDCDTQLTEPESIKRVESEHIFKNGKCTVCHYESDKQEEVYICEHTNTDETFTGNVSKTEEGIWRKGYFITYCRDCEVELSQPQYDERFAEHKFDGNGKCKQCGYVIQEEERTAWVYNTEGDNLLLRSSAGKTTILARMPEYSQITVIGNNTTNGYYKVKYNNISGWAHSDYITFSKVEQPTVNNSSYILPFSGIGRVTVLEYYWGKASSGVHPTKGSGNVRGAIDFAVTGSALATASGTVVEAKTGYNGGWGNYIVVSHENHGAGYSFYAHLSKISVSVNQKVNQGQAIGTIGSTGDSTGTHLHFEVWNSSKQSVCAIDLLKEQYKNRLRFDSDVVSGGSNSSSIRNWIVNNYALSNGVYIPKANTTTIASSTTSTSKPATTQQTTQTSTAVTNKKANFVNSNLQSWKGVLDSKFQAANAIYSVVNSVNIRTGIQKVLGTGVVAAWTISPGLLYKAFDEDVVIGIVSFGVTNEYLNRANVAHNSFLSQVNKGINTEEQAQKAFELYCESLACYNAVIDAHYSTVSEYAQGSTYSKKMLNTFFLSVVDAAIPDITKLKKVADATMTTAELLETVESGWSGLKSYKDTMNQWDNIWNKL